MTEDGLAYFSYVRILTDKDISNIASGFETRIQGNGRFQLSMMRTNYLKSLFNWVQDFYCTSEETKIKGIIQIVSLSQLERALRRNEIKYQ